MTTDYCQTSSKQPERSTFRDVVTEGVVLVLLFVYVVIFRVAFVVALRICMERSVIALLIIWYYHHVFHMRHLFFFVRDVLVWPRPLVPRFLHRDKTKKRGRENGSSHPVFPRKKRRKNGV